MSLKINNLVVNVHVADVAADKVSQQMESLRSEILEECKALVDE